MDRTRLKPIFYTICGDQKIPLGFLTFKQDEIYKRKICDLFRRPRVLFEGSTAKGLVHLASQLRLYTLAESNIINRVFVRKIDESRELIIVPVVVPPFDPDRVHDEKLREKLNSPLDTGAMAGERVGQQLTPPSIYSEDNKNTGMFNPEEIAEANRRDGV